MASGILPSSALRSDLKAWRRQRALSLCGSIPFSAPAGTATATSPQRAPAPPPGAIAHESVAESVLTQPGRERGSGLSSSLVKFIKPEDCAQVLHKGSGTVYLRVTDHVTVLLCKPAATEPLSVHSPAPALCLMHSLIVVPTLDLTPDFQYFQQLWCQSVP